MTNPINSSVLIADMHRFAVQSQLAADLIDKMNDSIVLAAQTATALRERLKDLPDLLVHLTALVARSQNTDVSLNAAKVWFVEKKQCDEEASPQAAVSHLSIIELSEREHGLLSWMIKQGLPEYQQLVETFLEAGLVRRDLEELAYQIDTTALPELLTLLEFMFATEAMTYAITSELVHLSAFVDAAISLSKPAVSVGQRD